MVSRVLKLTPLPSFQVKTWMTLYLHLNTTSSWPNHPLTTQVRVNQVVTINSKRSPFPVTLENLIDKALLLLQLVRRTKKGQ